MGCLVIIIFVGILFIIKFGIWEINGFIAACLIIGAVMVLGNILLFNRQYIPASNVEYEDDGEEEDE